LAYASDPASQNRVGRRAWSCTIHAVGKTARAGVILGLSWQSLLRQDGFDIARYEQAVQDQLGVGAAPAHHAFRNRLQLAGIEEAIANAAT
jgi:hypothetical protein